jgi:hypothetical protein
MSTSDPTIVEPDIVHKPDTIVEPDIVRKPDTIIHKPDIIVGKPDTIDKPATIVEPATIDRHATPSSNSTSDAAKLISTAPITTIQPPPESTTHVIPKARTITAPITSDKPVLAPTPPIEPLSDVFMNIPPAPKFGKKKAPGKALAAAKEVVLKPNITAWYVANFCTGNCC